MYSNIKHIEEVLSKKLNKDIQIKKQSFYVDDEYIVKGRIFVEGKEVPMKIDFYDLTEYNKRGILLQQLSRIANKLQETL